MHRPASPKPRTLCTPIRATVIGLAILELLESLGSSLVLADAQDVEADSLGQGAALADSDLVAGLDTESGRAVRGEVLVALFVSAVLGDATVSA